MKTIARHIINKFLKIIDKEKTLKTTGGKKDTLCTQEHRLQISHWKQWKLEDRNSFKILKELSCLHRFLHSVKISDKNEGKLKTMSDIQRLKEFITS